MKIRRWSRKDGLRHIPGPKSLPFLGNIFQLTPGRSRYTFYQWAKEFGPLYKVKIFGCNFVVVSDYDYLYDVLVKKGSTFAGRAEYFRVTYLFHDNGLNQVSPDASWRVQRGLGQRCLKQFGDGLSRIEQVNCRLVEDLLKTFANTNGQPFDPSDAIYDITLRSISTFIIGQEVNSDDPLFRVLQKYGDNALKSLTVSLKYLIIDMLPFLVNIPLSGSKDLNEVLRLQKQAWDEVKTLVQDLPEDSSFASYLIHRAKGKAEDLPGIVKEEVNFTQDDAALLCISMVTAGHVTTTTTMYSILNILAHRPALQEELYKESMTLGRGEGDLVMLADKPHLPLTMATILETLRYCSMLPLGVPRRSTSDTDILGVPIPKDTFLFINLWALHHDKSFWGDPEVFRPNRFLDSEGKLLPVEHEKRKHVLAFSAGVRACLGEQFALNRLFLWMANIVRRLKMHPAADNLPCLAEEPSFHEETLTKVKRYRIVFRSR